MRAARKAARSAGLSWSTAPITTSWPRPPRRVVIASAGFGPWRRNWPGQSLLTASGRQPTRRFSSPRVPPCGGSGPGLRAGMTRSPPCRPWSYGAARTAAALMLRSRASGCASGARPCGLMRPAMNWNAHRLPPIARPSGPWPTCFAGSRSQGRVPGNGSGTCAPFKRRCGAPCRRPDRGLLAHLSRQDEIPELPARPSPGETPVGLLLVASPLRTAQLPVITWAGT